MVGLGVLMIFMSGGMDMSLGATMGMAGIVTAWLSKTGLPLPVVILAAIGVGLAIGGFNGYIIGYLQFPAFIATLGSKQLVRGIINIVTKGYPINELGESFVKMGTGSLLGIPTPIWIAGLIAVITWYTLNQTVFGRRVAATGGNEQAAQGCPGSTPGVPECWPICMEERWRGLQEWCLQPVCPWARRRLGRDLSWRPSQVPLSAARRPREEKER